MSVKKSGEPMIVPGKSGAAASWQARIRSVTPGAAMSRRWVVMPATSSSRCGAVNVVPRPSDDLVRQHRVAVAEAAVDRGLARVERGDGRAGVVGAGEVVGHHRRQHAAAARVGVHADPGETRDRYDVAAGQRHLHRAHAVDAAVQVVGTVGQVDDEPLVLREPEPQVVGVGVGDLAEPDELVGGQVLRGVLRGTYVDAHRTTQPVRREDLQPDKGSHSLGSRTCSPSTPSPSPPTTR